MPSDHSRRSGTETDSASDDRLRGLVEGSIQGVLVHRAGGLLYANAAASRILGYNRTDDLIGIESVENLFHPDERERLKSYRQARMQGQPAPERYEALFKRKDGATIWVEVLVSMIPWDAETAILMSFIDVSERKRAEEELARSRSLLRTVFDSIPSRILVRDLTGAKILANRAWSAKLGITPEEFVALPDKYPNLRLDDIQWSEDALRRVMQEGESLEGELPVRRPYGGEEQVHYRIVPLRDDAGKTIGMVSVSDDITERKQVEDALRNAAAGVTAATGSEFFRSLVRYLGDTLRADYAFIGRVKMDDRDTISTIALWSNGELLPSYEYPLPGSPGETVLGQQTRVYPSNVRERFPTDQRLADKGVESYIGTPLFDSKGEPLGIMSVMFTTPQERTELAVNLLRIFAIRAAAELERLTTEEAQHASEEKFRRLAENIPGVVYLCRDDDRYSMLYLNDAVEELTGYDAQSFLDDRLSFVELVHPDDLTMVRQSAGEAIANHEAFQLVYRLRRSDGTWRWVEEHGVGVFRDDKVLLIEGVIFDVTERQIAADSLRELNEELEQRVTARTAELEASNRELESFSYSVSHDLRAPLRHVTGFVELLQRRTENRLDGESRRYLETISGSAKRMGQLIDDLLAFSHIGRVDMRHNRVDLDRLVSEVIDELGPDVQGRSIEWRRERLPIAVGDPTMLRLVMSNLIANAVKFTRGCEPARIDIGCTDKSGGTQLELYVRDNGVGFDMKYVDTLFGVFQRLHSAAEFDGTGIGLATVRRIVTRHGGQAWAESTGSNGATFYLSLPKAEDRSDDRD